MEVWLKEQLRMPIGTFSSRRGDASGEVFHGWFRG
jgi:hypothetical protein